MILFATGVREGYAFKKGPQGVGYYRDAAAAAAEKPREPPPAVPVPSSPADAEAAPADDDEGDDRLMQPLEGVGRPADESAGVGSHRLACP